jgi:hypothetical protein
MRPALLITATLALFGVASAAAQDSASNSFKEAVSLVNRHSHAVVLSLPGGQAEIAVWPAMQGRVLTSTASGTEGHSFGWFNQELIASGKVESHINAVGGEDRLWLGPEGGQFGLFFAPGVPFDLQHWYTPAPIDTEPFEVVHSSRREIDLHKSFALANHSGTKFQVSIDRNVKLLDDSEIWKFLGMSPVVGTKVVGFESINRLTNTGTAEWQKSKGLLSLWVLGQFLADPSATIVLPIRSGPESQLGIPVTTNYFGTVPPDRIDITSDAVFFKADAHYRAKLGVSPLRAKGVLGSYDPQNHVLTVIQYNRPSGPASYVNSAWKVQQHPYSGDVENCYNDGPPAPGKPQLGNFYEMESSSPALELDPHQSAEHTQRTIHIVGTEQQLDPIARAVFGVPLEAVEHFEQH